MTSSLQNTVSGQTPRYRLPLLTPAFGPAVTFNSFCLIFFPLWSRCCSVKVGGVKPMVERAQVLNFIFKKKKEKGWRRPGCAFFLSPFFRSPRPEMCWLHFPHRALFFPTSPLLLALERPRWWLSDLHWDIRVQRVLLNVNQSVGQRADAVFLHCVLGVLDFIKPAGWWGERGWRGKENEMGRQEKG